MTPISTLESVATPARRATSARGRTVAYLWIMLSAVAIAVFAPLPYFTTSLDRLAAAGAHVAGNYVARPAWAQATLYVHIVFGGLALLLSPLQFSARLRARTPRLHRVVGRTTLISIGLGGLACGVLAPLSLAGWMGAAGFGTLAVLWLWFAFLAYRAIRRRDVMAHRRWMIRTFALTYAAVTLRLWLAILVSLYASIGDMAEPAAFNRAYVLVPFLCWVPNLLVAELLLRKRPASTTPSRKDDTQ